MQLGLGMTEPKTMHYGLWDGSSTILCAYALVFILICFKRKEYPHVFMLMIPTSAMLLVLFYFPVIGSFLVEHIPIGESGRIQVLRRFRWILMTLPALAFGLTYITEQTGRLKKVFLTVISLIIIAISVYGSDWSSSGMKTGYWNTGNDFDHLYKLSNVTLAMGDTIMGEQKVFFEKDRYNFVSILVGTDKTGGKYGDRRDETYYVLGLRQYLSPIQYNVLDLTEKDYPTQIKGTDDYVLCPDKQDYINTFSEAGYEEEWRLDGYCFMRKVREI